MFRNKWILIVLVLFGVLQTTSAYAFVVTSPFGWREHPISNEEKFHAGVDLGEEYGTPIRVIWDGIVIYADENGGYGNMVLVQHDENNFTLYAHCSTLYVVPGQVVQGGQIIAAVGSTGYSTGPHVHVEYWHNGQYEDPMTIWPW